MNFGIAEMTLDPRVVSLGDDKQLELVRLNMRAGKEAFLSCAFGLSEKYLDAGLNILGDNDISIWKDNYDLALQLTEFLVETKFCMGNYVGSDCLAGSVKRHALPEDQFATSVCLVK